MMGPPIDDRGMMPAAVISHQRPRIAPSRFSWFVRHSASMINMGLE
jgi:hypothetical protein